ncbi:MAG: hypothetical protein KC457_24540, partial [Myxococcales bacterium]|nr:hypothetical protein [Myxococcales bacterium]
MNASSESSNPLVLLIEAVQTQQQQLAQCCELECGRLESGGLAAFAVDLLRRCRKLQLCVEPLLTDVRATLPEAERAMRMLLGQLPGLRAELESARALAEGMAELAKSFAAMVELDESIAELLELCRRDQQAASEIRVFTVAADAAAESVDQAGSMCSLQDHFLTVAKVLNTLANLQWLQIFVLAESRDFAGRAQAEAVLASPRVKAVLADPDFCELVQQARTSGFLTSPVVQRVAASKHISFLPNCAAIDWLCVEALPEPFAPTTLRFWRAYVDGDSILAGEAHRLDLFDQTKVEAALAPAMLSLLRRHRPEPIAHGSSIQDDEIELAHAEDTTGATQLDKSAIFTLLRHRNPGDMVWSMFRRAGETGCRDEQSVAELVAVSKQILEQARAIAERGGDETGVLNLLVLPESFYYGCGDGGPVLTGAGSLGQEALIAGLRELIAGPEFSSWVVVFGSMLLVTPTRWNREEDRAALAGESGDVVKRVVTRHLFLVQQGGFVELEHAHYTSRVFTRPPALSLGVLRRRLASLGGTGDLVLAPSTDLEEGLFEFSGVRFALEGTVDHAEGRMLRLLEARRGSGRGVDLQLTFTTESSVSTGGDESQAPVAAREGGYALDCNGHDSRIWSRASSRDR